VTAAAPSELLSALCAAADTRDGRPRGCPSNHPVRKIAPTPGFTGAADRFVAGVPMSKQDFLDGDRIRKAHSVRRIDPIFRNLTIGLAQIPELRYIKLFPERLTASNALSEDGKKNPVVTVGAQGLVAAELLIDTATRTVQFYALTSAVKGSGRKIVEAVIAATPEDWFLAVSFDWSGGFWQKMAQKHPRLKVS
jgi:hypothetical protein